MQMDEHESLKSLASRSVAQHEEMVGLLWDLQHRLETDSIDTIHDFNAKFMSWHERSQEIDIHLTEQLRRSNHSKKDVELDQLLIKRRYLQEQLVQLLKQSVLRAGSVKSLLACEMQSLQTGRRALKGYKNMNSFQGRIIDSRR